MKRPALRPVEYNSTHVFTKMETEEIDIGSQFIFDQLVETHCAELTMVFGSFMIQGRLSASDDLKITVARITHEAETHIGSNCLACGSFVHADGTCI